MVFGMGEDEDGAKTRMGASTIRRRGEYKKGIRRSEQPSQTRAGGGWGVRWGARCGCTRPGVHGDWGSTRLGSRRTVTHRAARRGLVSGRDDAVRHAEQLRRAVRTQPEGHEGRAVQVHPSRGQLAELVAQRRHERACRLHRTLLGDLDHR